MTVAAGLLFVGAALLLLNDRNPERRRAGMFGRLTGSVGAGMLGGLVTAVAAIALDALFIVQDDRSTGRQTVVEIGIGTYLLGAAVALAVFGAIRGGKPVDSSEPDSATPRAQAG